MIAWFAETFATEAPPAPDPDRDALDRLVTARRFLVGLATQIGQLGEHRQPRVVETAQRAIGKAITAQRAKLEAAIAAKIRANAAFAAPRHNPVIKADYRRLRANRKNAKVALVARMRKLIVILNTMLARAQMWNPPTGAVP